MTSVPTVAEEYSKMLEHLRKAQESSYMLAHLVRAQGGRKDNAIADGWFSVGELIKRMNYQITQLAQGRLQ